MRLLFSYLTQKHSKFTVEPLPGRTSRGISTRRRLRRLLHPTEPGGQTNRMVSELCLCVSETKTAPSEKPPSLCSPLTMFAGVGAVVCL